MKSEVEKKEEMSLTVTTPYEMIKMAVQNNADLDQLEKLLNIQERWEANQARKAYHEAMSKFKANPPKINKDKKVGYKTDKGGAVGYSHASLANITDKISSELSKYGLSASWTTKQDGVICVTCRITHRQGHGEETTLSAASDKSGSKNDIQAIGSTITYLERYTLLALTGLATFDQDDDGKASQVVDVITKEQHTQLVDSAANKNISILKLCEYLKVDDLENLPKTSFQKAMNVITQTVVKKKGI